MKKIIDMIKAKMFEVKEKINPNDESKVYYMNGNDGTYFDWDNNNRTCELAILSNNDDCYSVAAMVYDDGNIRCLAWKDGCQKATFNQSIGKVEPKIAKKLMEYLHETYDMKGRF